jgi:hypothetical protein
MYLHCNDSELYGSFSECWQVGWLTLVAEKSTQDGGTPSVLHEVR